MKLTYTQAQHLTQQQIQSVQLLQLSALELGAYIQELALSNPMVEPEDVAFPTERRQDDALLEKLRWLEENDRQNYYYQHVEREELDPLARVGTDGGLAETLFSFLSRQIDRLELDGRQKQTVLSLAACLDRNGYLRPSPEELSRSTGIPLEELEKATEVLRSLEPTGVGARDLSQCLALQLERFGETGPALAIARDYLQMLARRHYRAIGAKLGIPVEQVEEAERVIRQLEPRPGALFQEPEQVAYIVPDVFVEKVDGRLRPRVCHGSSPTFHISKYYRELLESSADREVRKYLSAKLRQAETVLWAIGQRERTLLRCTQIILDRQRDFFRQGSQALVPLSMADVALEMDVHESTVSRTVRGKYLQCDGVYPLSYFFTRPATENSGTRMGGTAARALLRKLIGSEDKRSPLSDQKLSERMAEEGCPISRRTVAKYRDELRIPSASARRQAPRSGEK